MKRLGLCGAVGRLLHSHSPPQPPPMPPRRHPGGWGAPEAVIFECATVFLADGGAFGACSNGPRPACSPAATRRPRHAPVVAIANTHHERHFATQQPHRPESERPQQPPPCACGRRAVRAAVCGVWRSSAHTNTQLAPPRWLCGQCPSSARRWGCMPVDVAVWAMAPLRGGTAPTRRGRATGKKDQPMTKNSELGCRQTPFR